MWVFFFVIVRFCWFCGGGDVGDGDVEVWELGVLVYVVGGYGVLWEFCFLKWMLCGVLFE